MTDEVDICNRALQQAGARDRITALAQSGSNEAYQCNLIFTSVRNQVLRMARWNFCRRTINMALLKAAPGTPENATITNTQWTPAAAPAPPWLYEYEYPLDCMIFWYLLAQPASAVAVNNVPIFSTPAYTFDPLMGSVPQKFTVATDIAGFARPISAITQANPVAVTAFTHTLATGNSVRLVGIQGMTELNNQTYTVTVTGLNTFTLDGVDSSAYTAYIADTGYVVKLTSPTRQNVILSNAAGGIGTYNMLIDNYDLWDSLSQQALISALAGHLAIPLSGNMGLAQSLIGAANDHIILARAQDGNEGYTIQDWTPDWIRARGGLAIPGDMGGQLITPYPPLFSVA